MPFIDPATCEPLRVFSRLEPRPRNPDFDRALRAEVHDPLWLLARQWQFGEFKGDDAGSAVTVKVAMRTSRIDALRAGTAAWQPVADTAPLEAQVEQLPIAFDAVTRADAGRELLAILDARGAAFDRAGHGTPYAPRRDRYRQALRARYPFAPATGTEAATLDGARQRSNLRAHAAQAALSGRALDGVALYRALPPVAAIAWSDLPSELALQIDPDHGPLVLASLTEFRAWFAGLYAAAAPALGAWNAAQLEYQFEARVAAAGAVLVADEYDSGRLDWYAFDLGPPLGAAATGPTEVPPFSVIPAPAEFPGMPNPRWWQLEDGSVDLGNLRGAATDIAKVVVAEFALLYGNNWFVIPCRQPVGTLAEIEGLVVTDVFGRRTLARPVNAGSGAAWTAWDFFSLSRRAAPGRPSSTIGAHLFLPPAVATVDEGEPIEAVAFLRDETTNTVWGVETRVPDGLGRGRDGNDAARQLRSALERIADAQGGPPPPAAPDAPLRYVLGTTVPENWIPLLPVHKPSGTRAIRLQRAAMPRFFLGTVRPVRPVTQILRSGLADDDAQTAPWFLEEEEVPREGAVVESSFQRARWLGGRTALWLGRRGRSGRGAGGSGLAYDVLRR